MIMINGDWHRAETIEDCCNIVEQFLSPELADIIREKSLNNKELEEQCEDYEEELNEKDDYINTLENTIDECKDTVFDLKGKILELIDNLDY